MKCPLCNVEAKVTSNKLVRLSDGSIVRRIRLSCVTPTCDNYRKEVKTIEIPQEISEG